MEWPLRIAMVKKRNPLIIYRKDYPNGHLGSQ
ncbi:Uncharacterised protein [Moellerella wisconsensis]|nr:Uncharacterised protein [Moellerella wisconsensis]